MRSRVSVRAWVWFSLSEFEILSSQPYPGMGHAYMGGGMGHDGVTWILSSQPYYLPTHGHKPYADQFMNPTTAMFRCRELQPPVWVHASINPGAEPNANPVWHISHSGLNLSLTQTLPPTFSCLTTQTGTMFLNLDRGACAIFPSLTPIGVGIHLNLSSTLTLK